MLIRTGPLMMRVLQPGLRAKILCLRIHSPNADFKWPLAWGFRGAVLLQRDKLRICSVSYFCNLLSSLSCRRSCVAFLSNEMGYKALQGTREPFFLRTNICHTLVVRLPRPSTYHCVSMPQSLESLTRHLSAMQGRSIPPQCWVLPCSLR